MPPTRTIAGLLGPPILAVALSMLVRPRAFAEVTASLESSLAVVYLTGLLMVSVGVAIVRVHNVWALKPPLIVTLVGWIGVLGGLARLLFPEQLAQRSIELGASTTLVMIIGAAGVVLGGYLIILSLPSRSDVSAAE